MAGLPSGSFRSFESLESEALPTPYLSLDTDFRANFYTTGERDEQTLDAGGAEQEPVDLSSINTDTYEVMGVQNASGAERPGGLQPGWNFQNRTESQASGEVAGSSRIPESPPPQVEFPQAPQGLRGEYLLLYRIETAMRERTDGEGRSVGQSLVLAIGKAIEAYRESNPGKEIPRATAKELLEYRLKAAESGYQPYTEAKDHKKGTLGSIHASIRSWLKNDQYIELQRSRLKHQALADADAAYKGAGEAYKLINGEYSARQKMLTTAKESFQELQQQAEIPGYIEEARSEILEKLDELDRKLTYNMGSAATPENFQGRLQRTMEVIQRADDAFTIARGDLKIVESLRFSLDGSGGQGGIPFLHADVRGFNRTLQSMSIEGAYAAIGNKIEALLGSIAELRRKVNEPLPLYDAPYVLPPNYP